MLSFGPLYLQINYLTNRYKKKLTTVFILKIVLFFGAYPQNTSKSFLPLVRGDVILAHTCARQKKNLRNRESVAIIHEARDGKEKKDEKDIVCSSRKVESCTLFFSLFLDGKTFLANSTFF